MKKLFTLTTMFLILIGSSCSYDDTGIWNSINNLEQRVLELEKTCKEINSNISAMQAILTALQNNDYVTSIVQVTENGETIGYTINFSKSGSVTIYHGENGKDGANGADGKDGVDGKDGYTPVIGVRQDTDGIYYWTLDGEWLTDENGNKIKAIGTDGKDGVSPTVSVSKSGKVTTVSITDKNGTKTATINDGADGQPGEDGNDGTSVTVKSVSESTADGGSNVVTFSDGKTLTVKNGSKGTNGTSVTVSNVSESTASGGTNVVTFSDGKKVHLRLGTVSCKVCRHNVFFQNNGLQVFGRIQMFA